MTHSDPTPGPPAACSPPSDAPRLPVDPDIEDPSAWFEPAHLRVLAAVSAGGALGALARYGAGTVWPSGVDFPWTTFAINVLGCLLLGLVVVIATERERGHPLLRPFLGTGVLGGFTTFSTYTVEAHRLLADGRSGAALSYLGVTLATAILAAAVGLRLGRRLTTHGTT